MPGRHLLILMASLLAVLPTYSDGAMDGYLEAGILSRDPYDMCDGLWVPGEQQWYKIDNFGTFALGDTVVVTAATMEEYLCNDYNTYSYLPGNTIAAWRGLDLGCGVVLVDPEYGCKGFESPLYGVFTILDGLGGFVQGDSAHVWGNASLEECMMIPECGFGYCFYVTRAVACPDSGSATRPCSWGRLRGLFR
ncbi:MAG: hypothetical protein ACE15D_10925 [Candidatus Eisenbacteria bacterium]